MFQFLNLTAFASGKSCKNALSLICIFIIIENQRYRKTIFAITETSKVMRFLKVCKKHIFIYIFLIMKIK